jgi:hypothetical protein
LRSSLHVYVEQNVASLGQKFLSGDKGRAVKVAMNLGPFGKIPRVAPSLELVAVQKLVINAVTFS